MKSSPLIWLLLDNVKSTVKTTLIFVAFLDNMNFTKYIGKYKSVYKKTKLGCPWLAKKFVANHFLQTFEFVWLKKVRDSSLELQCLCNLSSLHRRNWRVL